jgi:hypothetical protein
MDHTLPREQQLMAVSALLHLGQLGLELPRRRLLGFMLAPQLVQRLVQPLVRLPYAVDLVSEIRSGAVLRCPNYHFWLTGLTWVCWVLVAANWPGRTLSSSISLLVRRKPNKDSA